jgi:hypothetical protein
LAILKFLFDKVYAIKSANTIWHFDSSIPSHYVVKAYLFRFNTNTIIKKKIFLLNKKEIKLFLER